MSKKILYIDMDNTLVDFTARLKSVHPSVLDQYTDPETSETAFDEIPGLFALMPPKPGGVEAFTELSELFDTYILSTAPWGNPSAWQHKVEWVQLHLGKDAETPAYKRLILSHHKNLNRGDFLVDDRPQHRGADMFEGEVLHFGSPDGQVCKPKCQTCQAGSYFPDWPSVVSYLRDRATH